MSLKLAVLVSQYIAERNLFVVAVQHDLHFFHTPHPVILYLTDGTTNNGFVISQFTRGPKGGDVPAWALVVQSDKIQNPSAVKIVEIEILDSQ